MLLSRIFLNTLLKCIGKIPHFLLLFTRIFCYFLLLLRDFYRSSYPFERGWLIFYIVLCKEGDSFFSQMKKKKSQNILKIPKKKSWEKIKTSRTFLFFLFLRYFLYKGPCTPPIKSFYKIDKKTIKKNINL